MDYKVSKVLKPKFYDEINVITNSNAVDWDKFNSKTVLVTNASDFLGFYLILAFLNRNDVYNSNINILALVDDLKFAEDRFSTFSNREDISFVTQELSYEIAINKKADYIFCFDNKNNYNDVVTSTIENTNLILNLSKECNSKSLLYVSDASVYGKLYNSKDYINENDIGYIEQTSIENNYAFAKRSAEALCTSFCEEYNLNIKIVRPDVIYGVLDDKTECELFYFSGLDKNKDNIDILTNDKLIEYNSYCYITDAIISFLVVLINGENIYPYNICNSNSIVRTRDYTMMISSLFKGCDADNIKIDSELNECVTSPLSPNPNALDNSRLFKLGYTPETTLESGLKKVVQVFKEHIK